LFTLFSLSTTCWSRYQNWSRKICFRKSRC